MDEKSLRRLCAEAYVFCANLGAPKNLLDNLAAAVDGEDLPYDTCLPLQESEIESKYQELLARFWHVDKSLNIN